MINWEKLPEWHIEFKTVEWTSENRDKVGATVHITGETAGVKVEMDLETTELIENEKVAFRTIGGNMSGLGYVMLSPTKAGTKVTEVIDYQLPYSVLGKLIDKLRVHKAIDKSYGVALKNLKNMLEQ